MICSAYAVFSLGLLPSLSFLLLSIKTFPLLCSVYAFFNLGRSLSPLPEPRMKHKLVCASACHWAEGIAAWLGLPGDLCECCFSPLTYSSTPILRVLADWGNI